MIDQINAKHPQDAPQVNVAEARKQAMDTLSGATAQELSSAWKSWVPKPKVDPVRGPETGLVMVRGSIGGGGAPFNLGEATVTRATVKLSNGKIGHGYALGTDRTKVQQAAIFDALWQGENTRADVEERLIRPVTERMRSEDARKRDEVAATKVDFFTMVRGED